MHPIKVLALIVGAPPFTGMAAWLLRSAFAEGSPSAISKALPTRTDTTP